jgi:hypothetical protein
LQGDRDRLAEPVHTGLGMLPRRRHSEGHSVVPFCSNYRRSRPKKLASTSKYEVSGGIGGEGGTLSTVTTYLPRNPGGSLAWTTRKTTRQTTSSSFDVPANVNLAHSYEVDVR